MTTTLTAPAPHSTASETATPARTTTLRATTPRTTTEIALEPARLLRAKRAYTTRFLDAALREDATGFHVVTSDVRPQPGDVVLARVAEIGQHKRLESPVSRRQFLHVGDEVLVAYGHRYAPDQFEAEIPADLGPVNLVAAGGLAARVLTQHGGIQDATLLEPVGLLADADGIANLSRYAPQAITSYARRTDRTIPTFVVLGSSMNAGKSTTLASLVRGLTNAGMNVAAGKATGTGAGGDPAMFLDAGATKVLDFTDFGVPSTYKMNYPQLKDLVGSVRAELLADEPDVVVIEIADGVYQDETARLMRDADFSHAIDRVLFAAGEALGAKAGVGLLQDAGLDIAAVSGRLTSSPLAAREARAALDVPVIDTFDLVDPHVALGLLR